MQPAYFDNKTQLFKDELVREVRSRDRVAVAAATFSMYAYRELVEQLESLEDFRFIFTGPAFVDTGKDERQQREFYIPKLQREQGLLGTEFELRLKNELTQKAVAGECARWIKRKARFRSAANPQGPMLSLILSTDADTAAYLPLPNFSTVELGVTPSPVTSMVLRQDTAQSQQLLAEFDRAWNSPELLDVTDQVVDSISTMYRENPPELVYYATLYRIFHEFLEDVSPDELAKDGARFRESKIWNMLYDFQQDAVLAIINKLQTYNGCILADSVGLGKTFTALAVIKYYECLNRNVLVLCPKKLSDNWLTYRNNQRNNPIAQDRLRYDVLYHTDLSRERGTTATGLNLETINWGAYDLVVIDESHNFRNGADSARAATPEEEARENRYQRLLNRVLKDGVPITDLGLNDFRMDLVAYHAQHPEIERVPAGINAVVAGEVPGIIFVLRNVSKSLDASAKNPVHPFYLVYVRRDGTIEKGYLEPKASLDAMRHLCRGASEPDAALCRAYNKSTKDGRDMRVASDLLNQAVLSIVDEKAEADVESFFTGGPTTFLDNEVTGLDDFELVSFLVVR